ncbi:hypothetical protein BVRB_9g224530 [Beta vulgaris subsp. vulgaris]|uniref:Uncharacterized protein n=1 Tax=Beta vulgaris subsp. vulgaris TaxID=3555 RepID=A0A0J8B9K3_BETVV|nr:hypothetical protein BVRB_9g224530 [Beta vulgaris subsp. vulgaris]
MRVCSLSSFGVFLSFSPISSIHPPKRPENNDSSLEGRRRIHCRRQKDEKSFNFGFFLSFVDYPVRHGSRRAKIRWYARRSLKHKLEEDC